MIPSLIKKFKTVKSPHFYIMYDLDLHLFLTLKIYEIIRFVC